MVIEAEVVFSNVADDFELPEGDDLDAFKDELAAGIAGALEGVGEGVEVEVVEVRASEPSAAPASLAANLIERSANISSAAGNNCSPRYFARRYDCYAGGLGGG